MKKFGKKTIALVAGAVAALTIAGAATAAVIFNPADGTGFVGKGDVQLVYGWNDKQLQDNANDVQFRANSTEVTEVSWECTNDRNENIQERERTTTTSIEGLTSSVSREILKGGKAGKVNGFNLTGYDGAPTQSSSTEGPPLNSCPSGPWSLTSPAGDPEVISSSTVVQVSTNGADWFDLG